MNQLEQAFWRGFEKRANDYKPSYLDMFEEKIPFYGNAENLNIEIGKAKSYAQKQGLPFNAEDIKRKIPMVTGPFSKLTTNKTLQESPTAFTIPINRVLKKRPDLQETADNINLSEFFGDTASKSFSKEELFDKGLIRVDPNRSYTQAGIIMKKPDVFAAMRGESPTKKPALERIHDYNGLIPLDAMSSNIDPDAAFADFFSQIDKSTPAESKRHEGNHGWTTHTPEQAEFFEKQQEGIPDGAYGYQFQVAEEMIPPMSSIQEDLYKRTGKRIESPEEFNEWLKPWDAMDDLSEFEKNLKGWGLDTRRYLRNRRKLNEEQRSYWDEQYGRIIPSIVQNMPVLNQLFT